MTKRSEEVVCPDCGATLDIIDIPAWREFRLFGVTWIFGRWTNEVEETCVECRKDREDAAWSEALDQARSEAYHKGYQDGQGGY